MKIGVTAHFQFSIFSGGGAASAFAVAETLRVMGHNVTLLNTNGSTEWWDDLPSLKAAFGHANVCDVKEPFDLVLEVATNLPDKETRQRCGKHCVWVIRKPILLSDIENAIFPVSMGKRNLEGLTAVWCMDNQTTEDEMQYLETLARAPVQKVPFVWTPSVVEVHRRESGHPSWTQIVAAATQSFQKKLPWSVHVCETNNSATSSCTIPLVILRETKRQNQFPMEKYHLHNAQHIEKSEFFRQNVFAHCQIQDLSGVFQGRQRVCDWALDPMSCLLAHGRFRMIRPYLLDALWCRIPLVHNSPLLRDLGEGYENYFYEDNSILGGAKALAALERDWVTKQGMFCEDNQNKIIQKILAAWSPVSVAVQEGWRKAMGALPMIAAAVSPMPSATVAAQPLPIVAAPPVTVPVAPASASQEIHPLRVVFTDMWEGFNATYNMFLLILQEASKNLPYKVDVTGYTADTLPSNQKPNILVFGPFGNQWRQSRWSDVPKAHFTGENTQPIQDPKVFLNMCFPHADFVDDRYIRLPLWMLEIDWFGADPERIVNPKPLPIDRCTRTFPEEMRQHEKFCAFVVTNPCNPLRNNAFTWLSQYKRVDSAGRLFNNIGDAIFAGLGGGGGELKKHEFLKQYKFCLAYENASSQGYTTEKLLHAKAAGCIPIYWGDPKVERDFDPKGFIDARSITSPTDLIEAVRKIDENPELYERMYKTPALDEYKRDLVRRTLGQIGYLLLKAGLPQLGIKQEQIPRFLGATSSAEAQQLRRDREGLQPAVAVAAASAVEQGSFTMNPLVLTAATVRFLPSLYIFLRALAPQKKAVPSLDACVWLGGDVPQQAQEEMQKEFSFVQFKRLPESEVPAGFADYWDPQHFAWKLWILQQVSQDSQWVGRTILYMDAGVFLCRWPIDWLRQVHQNGICLLEDPRQLNEQWCHEVFCRKLDVTEAEKKAQQLWAGVIAWQGGSSKAKTLFAEAYRWSQDRDVIVGPKWSGVRDGKPFGHRHDQSILSILSMRQNIARYPMDELYCDISLKKTFKTGKSLYVHRGAFQLNKPFGVSIDEAYVINLDRRQDRMEKLFMNSPELKGRVERLSAVEGRQLRLTPALARLFRPHDFFWKKAIMGCALSHLTLWWQLAHEHPEIQSYLILEDDVKLQPGWEKRWEAAVGSLPEDTDVVYLGGILPPNRMVFERTKERVNEHFSKVAPNQIFGQKTPNRYFHFCAYAYVLTKTGAQKILDILKAHDGYWTSADHMICNPVDLLNLYFLDPLVAGCYQDEDPKYQTSAFNDFSRIDGFDSDLWNNDERFPAAEVDALLRQTAAAPLAIDQALKDARLPLSSSASPPTAAAIAKEVVIGKESRAHAIQETQELLQGEALKLVEEWTQASWTDKGKQDQLRRALSSLKRSSSPSADPRTDHIQRVAKQWQALEPQGGGESKTLWANVLGALEQWSACTGFLATGPSQSQHQFYTLKQHCFNETNAYEREWIEMLLGKEFPFWVQAIEMSDMPTAKLPIVIIQRPHTDAYVQLLKQWNDAGKPFYVFHVSDEYLKDRIDFYEMPMCKGVVRIYTRSDIPEAVQSKVLTLPLGFHWTLAGGSEDPLNKTPRLPFRNLIWSFFGTNWQQRESTLQPLTALEPHQFKLVNAWDSPEKLTRNQYLAMMLNSVFVPCPGGNHFETFRLYEALECGCVPLYVRCGNDDEYIELLQNELGLLTLKNWEEAKILVEHFMKQKDLLENYRNSILTRWKSWRERLGLAVKKTWGLTNA